jgi:hypothetical protein
MIWQQKGPDKKIWTEYVNDDTGESSIKDHTLKVVKQWCAKDTHNYKITDASKRIAVCTKCDHETTFIVGKDTIEGNFVVIA